MKTTFHYGAEGRLELDLPEDVVLYVHGSSGTSRALTDSELDAAIGSALENPLELPAFRLNVMPGDWLVVPVAPGVPKLTNILRMILTHVYTSEESRPGHVTFLFPTSSEMPRIPVLEEILPEGLLSAEDWRERVTLERHDPEQKECHALLGVSETGESLVVNRHLFDADCILPVGVFLPRSTTGYFGLHSPLYPLFSDAETKRRFQGVGEQLHAQHPDLYHQLEAEVAEVTRQIGVMFFLEVVPGVPGTERENVAQVLVGEFHEVAKDGYSRYQEIWTSMAEGVPNVVLASITGGEMEQTWENASRALVNAAALAGKGGILVLCSDLGGMLSPPLHIYRQVQDVETATKFIHQENAPDAQSGLELINVIENHRVFFVSRMDGDVLEEINIMPLDDPEDLRRLILRSGTCVFLPDAHRIVVSHRKNH